MPIDNTHAYKRDWMWLIPLLLVMTWLGARQLNADPFWVDEVRSIQRAGEIRYDGPLSPAEIWQRTSLIPDQVPGYYLVLAGWGALVGLTEFASRALSLLFGLLTIAGVYRLGHDLHSPLAGFGAAIALSASAYFVIYLHELRTYTLITLLTVLLLWLYWRILRGERHWLVQIGLILSVAGLLYSHYFSVIMIGAVCLYHLLFVPKNREWWRVVILMGGAGLLFLPWVLTAFNLGDTVQRIFDTQYTPFEMVRRTLANVLVAFSNGSIALLGVIGAFALQWRKRGVAFILFLTVTGLGSAAAINLWLGFISVLRYLLPMWIPLALLVGVGIAGMKRAGLRPVWILSLLIVVGLWNNLDPRVAESIYLPIRYLPWNTLTDELKERGQPGDVLAFLLLVDVKDWNGDHVETAAHYLYNSPIEIALIESRRMMTDADYLYHGREAIQHAIRVWLSYAPDQRPWRTGMFQDMLTEEGFACCGSVTDTSELYLDLYARAPLEDSDFVFGGDSPTDQIQLDLLEPIPETVQDSLAIAHSWRLGDAVPRNTYSVALHVEDSDGNLVAQLDYGLPAEAFGCTTTTLDVSYLLPGDYTLLATVYAWETGERIPAVHGPVDESGQRLILGAFTVE